MVNRDRGQLLVIGALVIAVILMSVVLVLNGTMYVEHVGGSDGSSAARDAAAVRSSVGTDLDRLTQYTADGQGYANTTSLDAETDAFSANYSRFAASGGSASVAVTLNRSASTNVTRVTDDGLGSRPPNDDVVLVTESEARAHGTRVVDFDVNFTVGDQLEFNGGETYTIRVTDATTPRGNEPAAWSFSFDRADSPSGTEDVVFESSGPTTCGRESLEDGDRIHIDVDEGIVEYADGTDICTFEFPAGVSPPYGLSIENRGRVGFDTSFGGDHGTFDLVLSEYVPGIETRLGSGEPTVLNATRSAAYDLTYESPSLRYGTVVTAPVENRRVPLLVEDFEDGWDGAWEKHGSAGDAGVREDAPGRTVAHSGVNATYIEGVDGNPTVENGLVYNGSLETTEFDTVEVMFQTRLGAGNPPEAGDPDEHLIVEYDDGTGWAHAGNTTIDSSQPLRSYAFSLTENATHDDFRLRFRRVTADATDTWYIDDIVVYGVNES